MNIDFDAAYQSHYRRVFGLCLQLLGSSAAAEDAAQEVFMRAYRSLNRYDPNQPLSPWLLGIARNHCIDRLRRRAKAPRLFDDDAADADALESDAPEACDLLAGAERRASVRAAIAGLPDRYRVPIVLAYYDEQSYDDIAATLGISRNHVGVLLLRGKRALRRTLAGLVEESSS